MRKFLAPTLRRIKRLFTRKDGVAAVEFALIAPIMLTLYLGSLEVSRVVSVNTKLSSVTSSLSDLVARVDRRLEASSLDDILGATTLIMRPYPTDTLQQRVSHIRVESDGTTQVIWSVGYGGAQPYQVNSSVNLPGDISNLARDSWVVMAESQMSYSPLAGHVLKEAINLSKTYYNLPRFPRQIDLIGNSSTGTHGSLVPVDDGGGELNFVGG